MSFSRLIVGWQVGTSLPTDLALDALLMAIWRCQTTGAGPTGSPTTATANRS